MASQSSETLNHDVERGTANITEKAHDTSPTSSTDTLVQPLPPIDGGFWGWATVIGSWLVQFCMVGMVSSFGVTQTYYSTSYLSGYTDSDISWIGTVTLFLEYGIGIGVGQLLDKGHFHRTVVAGTGVFVFSIFMLSLAKDGQFYQVFLSQGAGMGVGLGIVFLPTSGIVANHFHKRRALAMGIVTTGTSLGGFFFSVILNKFLNGPIGFAWGIRISAFICLVALVVANLLMRPHPKSQLTAPVTDVEKVAATVVAEPKPLPPLLHSFKNPAYVLTITYGFIVCLGLWFPMFSIELFALQHGFSSELASWLLPIINLSSVLGRLIPNALADRYGVWAVYAPCTALAGVLVLVMLACTIPATLIAFCVLYGFFSGSIVSLYFPAVLAIDPQVTASGARLGLACMPVAFALLIGPPISAALVGNDERWWAGCVFAGVTELASAGLLVGAYICKKRMDAKRAP